ncbi:unnamed protein product, partial [marine sediment metagenome]
QMHITMDDSVGKLAEVTGKIKDAGVNIFSLAAWTEGGKGNLMTVTDDNDKACGAIGDLTESCREDEAVYVKVPHEAGSLNAAAGKLADAGINIQFVYATTAEAGEAGVILVTSDNAKAAEIL